VYTISQRSISSMIPRNANRQFEAGKTYDWRTTSATFGAIQNTYWYTPLVQNGSMPMNMSHKRRKGTYTSGGPWAMFRYTATCNASPNTTVYRQGEGVAYKGIFYLASHPSGSFLVPPVGWADTIPLLAALSSRGSELWNRMRPDQPSFTGFQQMGELREAFGDVFEKGLKGLIKRMADHLSGKKPVKGLARLPSRRNVKTYWKSINRIPDANELRRLARRGNKTNLSIALGWLPMKGAIEDFIDAYSKLDERLQQLIRDAGRPVRRKLDPKKVTDSENQSSPVQSWTQRWSNGYSAGLSTFGLVTQCFGGESYRDVLVEKTSKTWAVGKFRYVLPPGPKNAEWTHKMRMRLLGNNVTPSAVYELTPWSFVADYFTDFGEFMKAVSPGVADRLICDYAYIMKETSWKSTTEAVGGLYTSPNKTSSIRASYVTEYTRKLRVAASPFGWGLKESDLSDSQKAILAGLGAGRLL